MIKLEHVVKTYENGKRALDNISLSFENYGLHIITGPSGSGKSTLLNVISLLDSITGGRILFQNKEICNLNSEEKDRFRSNGCSFIFQEYNLIEDMTVLENLEICNFDERKIDQILEQVGLADYKNTPVKKLSGGERQRVAIARALVKDTKVILADEPTGNLDEQAGRKIMDLLKLISKNHLVILVTHNSTFANSYADRLIKIESGKIIADILINKTEKIPDSNDFSDSEKCVKKNISLKNCLPDMKNELRKIRSFLIIILFSFLLMTFSFLLYKNEPSKIIQNNLLSFGYRFYELGTYNEEVDKYQALKLSFSEDYQKLKAKQIKVYPYVEYHSPVFYDDFYHLNDLKILFIDEFEMELAYGDYPQDDFDIIVSDYVAEVFLKSNFFPDASSVNEIIGLRYQCYFNNFYADFKITGIYKTVYKSYYDNIEEIGLISELFKEKDNYLCNFIVPLSSFSILSNNIAYSETGLSLEHSSSYIILNLNDKNTKNIIYEDSQKQDGVYITTSYLRILGYDKDAVLDDPETIYRGLKTPFPMHLQYNNKNESIDIVGIVDNTTFLTEDDFLLTQALFAVKPSAIWDYSPQAGLMLDLTQKDSLKKVWNQNYNIRTDLTIFEKLESAYSLFRIIFMIVGLILLIIYIILYSTYIMFIIEEKKYAIGVYRSLGYSKKEINKFFLYKNLIVSGIEIIVLLVIIVPILFLTQRIPINHSSIKIILYEFDLIDLLILFVPILIINMLLAYLSINKLNKKPISNIIRNI